MQVFKKILFSNLLLFLFYFQSAAQYTTGFEVANNAALLTEGWHSLPGYGVSTVSPRNGTRSMRSSPNAIAAIISPMFDFGSTAASDAIKIWYRRSGGSSGTSATITISLADISTGAVVAGSTVSVTGIGTSYSELTLNVTESGIYRIRIETNTVPHGAARVLLDDFSSDLDIYSVPLPISLLYFKGSVEQNVVKLKWATATEKNNSHFEVLRSSNAKDFTHVGRVDGHGNSVFMQNYSFEDKQLEGAGYYYKLVQKDFDGSAEEFNLIYIANPNTGTAAKCKVYDMTGKPVFNGIKEAFLREAEKGKLYMLVEGKNTIRVVVQ